MVRRVLARPEDVEAGFTAQCADGALLFVDVNGYTRLTYEAAREGPDSLEALDQALNALFCGLIDEIAAHGGDVITFEGDGLTALFEVDGQSAQACVRRAARCAIAVKDLALSSPQPPSAGSRTPPGAIRSRLSLGYGAVCWTPVGRPHRRRHVLFFGEALRQVAQCHGTGAPGEIAVSAVAAGLLADAATFADGEPGAPVRLLGTLHAADEPEASADVAADPPPARLTAWLRPSLAERVLSDQASWLAEMRFVCAVFASIEGPRDGAGLSREDIDATVCRLEDALLAHGGEVSQVRADGERVIVIGMLGTPGCTHEDDPARAAACVASMAAHADETSLDIDVGLSCGVALCALYGNARRQDVVVLGDVMNLAARLMQCREGALCDRAMQRLVGPTLVVTPLGPRTLKGFQEPVEVLRVVRMQDLPREPRLADAHEARVVGRVAERTRLEAAIDALLHDERPGRAGILLIEGEAGIGKSTLVQAAVNYAGAAGAWTIVAGGSRIERLTAYFVWRSVLAGWLDLQEAFTAAQRTDAVLRGLEAAPELLAFAPLLADVVALTLEPSALTLQMDPSARSAMIARLLIQLLESTAPRRLLLVFEDGHWIDSASWPIIAQLHQSRAPVLILITARPEGMSSEASEVVAPLRAAGMSLGGLSLAETHDVVCSCLHVNEASDDVVRFIQDGSGGNPFFAEELALTLSERGHLRVEGGMCWAATRLARHLQMGLPNTLLATLRERIDRMSACQQTLLKIAGVIGTRAPLRAVVDIFESQTSRALDMREFDGLHVRRLADLDELDGTTVLSFRHAITQEAAYELLTPSQQRHLHEAVARWYEAAHRDDPGPCLPLLAYHFDAAQIKVKARHYLGLAGEQALGSHANHEAAQFLERALALESPLDDPLGERVLRRRLLAEAKLKLSHLGECRHHLHEAMRILGRPVPETPAALAFDLASCVASRFAPHTPSRKPAVVTDQLALPPRLVDAQLHQLRAEVAYFEHDSLGLLHATFAGLRAAASCGPSRELACASGTVAIVFGLLRLRRLSERHFRAAVATAEAALHPPTAAYVQHLGSVCASGIGDWATVETRIALAAEGYKRGGDLYRWQSTRMILAYQALHRGDFDRIVTHLAEADERSMFPSGPLQLRTWFRTSELARTNAMAALGRGNLAAPALVAEVQALAGQVDASQALLCRGFAADAWRLYGDGTAAVAQARLGLEVLRTHRPTTYFSLFGIASIVEALVSRAEQNAEDQRTLQAEIRQSLQCLARFSWAVPIAVPCLSLLRGRALALAGAHAPARRHMQHACRHAARLGMKGVESAARAALDRIDDPRAGARKEMAWA